MSWFRTIRARYTLVFSCLSLVFLAVVTASFSLISFIQTSAGRYVDGASLIQNADRDLYQSRLALANLLSNAEASTAQITAWRTDTESNAEQALQRMQSFQEKNRRTARNRQLFAAVQQTLSAVAARDATVTQ